MREELEGERRAKQRAENHTQELLVEVEELKLALATQSGKTEEANARARPSVRAQTPRTQSSSKVTTPRGQTPRSNTPGANTNRQWSTNGGAIDGSTLRQKSSFSQTKKTESGGAGGKEEVDEEAQVTARIQLLEARAKAKMLEIEALQAKERDVTYF